MSLRTRKSKKQKLNRRKSLKIGGMIDRVTGEGNDLSKGAQINLRPVHIDNVSREPQNITSVPYSHVKENLRQVNTPPTTTRSRSPAPSRASGASTNIQSSTNPSQAEEIDLARKKKQTESSTGFPRSPLNPLCNISEGDLVQSRDNKIAYVTEISGSTATLSNSGGQKQISELAKYEYHDILTSLSNILNFVLNSKENVPSDKDKHIANINAMKESLEKITPTIQ